MSIKAIKQALLLHHLTSTQQLVLIRLANFLNDETGLCCPSEKTLSEECSLSDRCIRQTMATLELLGIIQRTKRWESPQKQLSSSYKLIIWGERSSGGVGELDSLVNQKKELNLNDATSSPKKTVTALTRKAYTEAFTEIYMVPPRWTAKDNNLIENFVRQIGNDTEAAAITRHYLTMRQYGVTKNMHHPVRNLLRDAAGIDADMRRSWIVMSASKTNVLPFATKGTTDEDF